MYRSRSGYYTIDQKKCSDPWVIGDKEQDRWLEKVNQNTWKTFDEIGKVRVGIKTTADNIFLFNKDAKSVDIELIKELITHRNAGCYLANNKISWSVLYPHKSINGKKTVIDIDLYPKTKSYLLEHFDQLNNRNYIKKAKRKWYEIWVPQNPALWSHRKIVFRDITEFPQFWYVSEDAVVNGDCYWIDFNNTVSEEIIYLMLAVANSQFIVNFYDRKFNTKLYSSKRRFMTQYVEKFPLPDPTKKESLKIISIVKEILNSQNLDKTQKAEIDSLVEKSFS